VNVIFGTLLDFEEKLRKRRFFNAKKGLFCEQGGRWSQILQK
jgi:hypothetical protein